MTLPQRVLVAGYYGAKNAGDEAILSGLLASFRAAGFEGEFTVLSHDPADTRDLHGVEAVAWSDIEAIIGAAEQADLVVVGGGGLFHDYWGVDPTSVLTARQGGIAQYAAPVYIAAMLEIPCALIGVGVGPLNSPEGIDLTRTVFDLVELAFVRDRRSFDLVRRIGALNKSIFLGSDLAFAAPQVTLPPQFVEFLGGFPRPLLSVALRHWPLWDGTRTWESEVAAALDAWQEDTGGTPLFVPMQAGSTEIEDDISVARRIRGLLRRPEATATLPEYLNPLERFWAVGVTDLALAMRMHALVSAQRNGVPCVGMVYDPKVDSAMSLSQRDSQALPPSEWTSASILERLNRLGKAADTGRKISDPSGQVARVLQLLEAPPRGRNALHTAARSLLSNARVDRDLARRLRRELAAGREHREKILVERNVLEEDLAALRGTLGVQVLDGYWRMLRRLVPEGTKRKRAYRLLALTIRRSLHRFGTAEAAHSLTYPWRGTNLREGGLDETDRSELSAAADPRIQLLRFEETWADSASMVFAILSATDLIRSEGQRPTQISIELSRRGLPVVFSAWRWDRSRSVNQERIGERILHYPLDLLLDNPHELLSSHPGKERIAVFEFPHPDLFGLMAAANASGWLTIYDVVDDWEGFHRSGWASWYKIEAEKALLASADVVLAVNHNLVERIRRLGRDEVILIPNGFADGIEAVGAPWALPRGEVTIVYWGHLAGSWFDWELICESARREPKWLFYLAGYGGEQEKRQVPENIRLLGRLPQSRLASLAQNVDVAIIPFKPGNLSDGADAIKLYEYLAMGLPVVTTGVSAPEGAQHLVRKAEGLAEFVDLIRLASNGDGAGAEDRRRFAATNSWRSRTDEILEIIARGEQGVASKRDLFG